MVMAKKPIGSDMSVLGPVSDKGRNEGNGLLHEIFMQYYLTSIQHNLFMVIWH